MRSAALNIRLTEEEIAAFKAIALPIGLSVSSWARSKLIRAALVEGAENRDEKPAAKITTS